LGDGCWELKFSAPDALGRFLRNKKGDPKAAVQVLPVIVYPLQGR
jgi:hypothetical protein